MRIRSMVAVLVMGLGASANVTARPQPEAVMTISGIAGQFAVRADRTDWTQIKGMPDPRDSQGSGIDSLTGSRAGSLLTSQGTPPGADRGRVGVQDFSITKDLDKASPKLDLACTSGEHIGEVVLEISRAGGSHCEVLVITMRNVVISSIERHPAVGREAATEVVTFRYASLEWESRPASASLHASPPPYSITPRPR